MKKNSLLSLMMASAVLLSSCSSIIDSGYIGYKKNEMKYGKEVARQFRSAILLTNIEWLSEFMTEYPDFNINYYSNEESQYQGYDYETIKVICTGETFVNFYQTNKMLEFLLQNGLDPNIKFSNGYYALDWLSADYKFKPFLVKTMLENGADPNNGNTAGFYNVDLGESNKEQLFLPIYWGIYKPMYTNAEDMLNHGAEVSFKILDEVHDNKIEGSAKSYQLAFKSYMERTGESPFTKAEEYAILGESDKLIEELKNGVEIDEKAARVISDFICRFCNVEALKAWDEFYSGSTYEYKNLAPWRMLNGAAYEGNYEIVKYLFDEQLIDFSINTALKYAAQSGSYDVCKYILENGSLEEQTSCNEFLEAAYESKNSETFRLLANYFNERKMLNEKKIYYIFKRQTMEWSPFTKSVIDCLTDDCGLKLNGLNCYYIDYETIKYLFEKGKQLSVFDLPMAIVSHDMQAIEYILEQGADPNQDVFHIILGLDPEVVENLFLPYDEALSALNGRERGCFKYAIRYGTSEIVQLLIDHGADVSDESILACAVSESSKATFDVLFNAGASLDYKNDEDKETLIDAAKSMGRDDIVKILRKAGVRGYWGF